MFRIFPVLRGLRAARVLTSLVLPHRAENTFLAASLLAMLLVIFCSSAILHFETAPESNIKTAEDAIWWSFTTITTVGYGDRFPVTSEGRIIAVLLMCALYKKDETRVQQDNRILPYLMARYDFCLIESRSTHAATPYAPSPIYDSLTSGEIRRALRAIHGPLPFRPAIYGG
jgi:hypothetical protein